MRRITFSLLWLFVFSVPWGIAGSVLGIGTITRLLGMAAVLAGVLTAVASGRLRRPGAIFWFTLAFVVSGVVSLLWTVSYAYTAERVETYIQFLGLIWLVREFARTPEDHDSLLLAFSIGAFLVAAGLLWNFNSGIEAYQARYSASNLSPNYVGFSAVMGFLMAWRLFLNHRGIVRLIAFLCCVTAPLAILLTGSRSAILAGVVALTIVPLTLRRQSTWSLVRIAGVLAVVAATIVTAPASTWNRLFSTRGEIESGTLGGRGEIWDAGWQAFQERPVLGVGAGAFPAAVEPTLSIARAGHNMPLALLVEQGILGLFLFGSLLGACVWTLVGLPPTDRKLWAVLMLAWLIIATAHDAHSDRITWVLLGLLTARESIETSRARLSRRQLVDARSASHSVVTRAAHPRRLTSVSTGH